MNTHARMPLSPIEIDRLVRDTAPAALGVLLRNGTNFDDGEDAVQQAVLVALETWPEVHQGTLAARGCAQTQPLLPEVAHQDRHGDSDFSTESPIKRCVVRGEVQMEG